MKLNINYIKKIFSLALVFFAPLAISWAGLGSKPSNLKDIAATITETVNLLVPILVTLALVAFLWGVSKTIINSDSEDARKKGRDIMVYGIISLFVIASLWGILNMARGTFF